MGGTVRSRSARKHVQRFFLCVLRLAGRFLGLRSADAATLCSSVGNWGYRAGSRAHQLCRVWLCARTERKLRTSQLRSCVRTVPWGARIGDGETWAKLMDGPVSMRTKELRGGERRMARSVGASVVVGDKSMVCAPSLLVRLDSRFRRFFARDRQRQPPPQSTA